MCRSPQTLLRQPGRETKASAKVAMREDVCRRRKWLRLAWARKHSWMWVEDAAATTLPIALTTAQKFTDVNRGASETDASSAEVLSSAQSLAHESNRLKPEVRKLLEMVRAA